MSLPLPDIASILKDHISDHATLTAILKDLVAAEKEVTKANDEEKTPKLKQTHVVMIRGDANLKKLVAGGAWLIKQPENTDTSTLLERIKRAVITHNENLKGKSKATKVIKTFARAFDLLRPKMIERATASFKVTTKTPVEVVVLETEDII